MTLPQKEKAITTADITCTLEQMRLDDANIFLDKKWVPLEEAQKLLKEQKIISDSDLDSWKKYTDYQLKQKDGIIDRLNETIESEENENISLENKLKHAKKNNTFSHKRILELEDKIERAKRILNDFVIQFDFGGSITSQRALINEARSILVLNQEKKEPYCFGKFDKKCEDCQSYCMYRGACEKTSVANGENKQ